MHRPDEVVILLPGGDRVDDFELQEALQGVEDVGRGVVEVPGQGKDTKEQLDW